MVSRNVFVCFRFLILQDTVSLLGPATPVWSLNIITSCVVHWRIVFSLGEGKRRNPFLRHMRYFYRHYSVIPVPSEKNLRFRRSIVSENKSSYELVRIKVRFHMDLLCECNAIFYDVFTFIYFRRFPFENNVIFTHVI